MKRESKKVISGVTTSDMEANFATYAAADAEICKINASMDMQITKIRERYSDQLTALQKQKEDAFDILQQWAVERRDELFIRRKSINHNHGTIGFRIGTPKLKTLRGFTWGAVLNLIREFLPQYIRTSEEVAKDRIIIDRCLPEVSENLGKCGIQVIQDETFFIELKKEENDEPSVI